MSRIVGSIGQDLAAILDVEGGRVDVRELRDQEGVSLVYDLAPLAAGHNASQAIRTFDTGAVAQSTTSLLSITGFPGIFSLQGLTVAASDPTRIEAVDIKATSIGLATQTNSDWFLWHWASGGTTHPNPFATIGGVAAATVQSILVPAAKQDVSWPVTFVDQGGPARGKRGVASIDIRVRTTAFGAGTAEVSGSVVLAFHVGSLNRNVYVNPPPHV